MNERHRNLIWSASLLSLLIICLFGSIPQPTWALYKPWQWDTGDQVYGIKVADINGDGDNELVVLNLNDNIYVYSDSYGLIETIATGKSVLYMDVGDIGSDGDIEIAVSCLGGSGGVAIYNSTYQLEAWISTSASCRRITIADADGDGVNDLLFGSDAGSYVVYVYDKDYSLIATLADPNGAITAGIAVGDIGDDGIIEIAVLTDNRLYVYTENFELIKTVIYSAIKLKYDVDIADIDNDYKKDLIVLGMDDEFYVFSYDLSASTTYYAPYLGWYCLIVTDLDYDFCNEVVLSSDKLAILEDIDDCFWAQCTGAEGQSAEVADLDGDGIMEIFQGQDNGLVKVFRMQFPRVQIFPPTTFQFCEGTAQVPAGITAAYLNCTSGSGNYGLEDAEYGGDDTTDLYVLEYVRYTRDSAPSSIWLNYTLPWRYSVYSGAYANGSLISSYTSGSQAVRINATQAGLTSDGLFVDVRYYYWVELTVSDWTYDVSGICEFTVTPPTLGVANNLTLTVQISAKGYPVFDTIEVDGVAMSPDNYTATSAGTIKLDLCFDAARVIYLGWSESGWAPYTGIATISNRGPENYLFAEEAYYEFSASYVDYDGWDDLEYVQLSFFDGANAVNVTYTLTSEAWSVDSDAVMIRDGEVANTSLYRLDVTYYVYLTGEILDAQDLNIYLYCVDLEGHDSGWSLGNIAYFSIYNLGGYSITASSGTAGRTAGGDIFELYATGPNSWAYAEQYWKNLKHINTMFYIGTPDACFDGDTDTFFVEWGIDYWDPVSEVWMHGWKLRLNVTDGHIEDDGIGTDGSWVEFQSSWYQGETLIKQDKWIALAESIYSERDAAGVILDLWFNKINASSVAGGRVNAIYFGMEQSGTWFFPWWDPANWGAFGIMATNVTQSMYFEGLLDGNGEAISATRLKLMKVWAKVYTGPSETHTIVLKDFDIFEIDANAKRMEGINTPILVATRDPNLPVTGFYASLYYATTAIGDFVYKNALLPIWNYIQDPLKNLLVSVTTTLLGGLDALIYAILPGAGEHVFTDFIATIALIFGYVGTALTYLGTTISTAFAVLVQSLLFMSETFIYIVYVLTGAVTYWVKFFQFVRDVFTGGYSTGVNIWVHYGGQSWFTLAMIMYPLYLVARCADEGSFEPIVWHAEKWRDIIWLIIRTFAFIFSFIWTVTNTIIGHIRGSGSGSGVGA